MLQYSARIRELRKLGYQIENKSERVTNGYNERVRYGYFRLVSEPDGEETIQPTDEGGIGQEAGTCEASAC